MSIHNTEKHNATCNFLSGEGVFPSRRGFSGKLREALQLVSDEISFAPPTLATTMCATKVEARERQLCKNVCDTYYTRQFPASNLTSLLICSFWNVSLKRRYPLFASQADV